jgi:hypothetical protein
MKKCDLLKFGTPVRHKACNTSGICQGESIEHTGWYVVIWNDAGPNDWPAGYCYHSDDLELNSMENSTHG